MTADTKAPSLLPCPFCGGNTYSFVTDQGDKWGHVQCGCGVSGPEVRTSYDVNGPWKNDAINEWNTRATPTPTEARERNDFARRCQAYLDDAPLDGRHSDAAGSNAYELIEEAIEHCSLLPDADAIRADERERCAKIAADHSTKEFDEAWIIARGIRYRTAVEIAKDRGADVHPRAAAIRAAGGEA